MSVSPNFTRYADQTNSNMDAQSVPMSTDGFHQQHVPTSDIPPLMSLVTTGINPKLLPRSNSPSSSTVVKDGREPFSFPCQPPPGPIQRPTKLSTNSNKSFSSFLATNDVASPSTPDVLLDQISRLVDHPENITSPAPLTTPASATVTESQWSPFAPSVWSTPKDDLPFVISPLASAGNLFASVAASTNQNDTWQQKAKSHRSATWNDLFSPVTPDTLGVLRQPSKTIGSEKENSNWLWQDGKAISNSERDASPARKASDFWDSVLPAASGSSSRENWNWPISPLPPTSSVPDENNNNETDSKPQSKWDFAR